MAGSVKARGDRAGRTGYGRPPGRWKAPRTGSLERLPYMGVETEGCGDEAVPAPIAKA
jgi:hypothetical protein